MTRSGAAASTATTWPRRLVSSHSIGGAEIAAHICDELTVGGMVDGLDSYDLRREPVVVLVNVLDELELCRGGPDDEYFLGVLQSVCDVVIETLRVGGVTSFRGHGRMPTHVARWGAHRRRVETLAIDMKYSCFLVINPNGGVLVGHGRAPMRGLYRHAGVWLAPPLRRPSAPLRLLLIDVRAQRFDTLLVMANVYGVELASPNIPLLSCHGSPLTRSRGAKTCTDELAQRE